MHRSKICRGYLGEALARSPGAGQIREEMSSTGRLVLRWEE
jgi:hypothetical protein